MTPARTHYDATTGQVWAPYRVTYELNGIEFDARLQATSFAHAEQMLEDLKKTGEVVGVVILEDV